jgi:FHA domain
MSLPILQRFSNVGCATSASASCDFNLQLFLYGDYLAWAVEQPAYNMQYLPTPQNEIDRIRIELLDPSSGRPMNCWKFNEKSLITIGRSPEQDVEITDPYVSRHHASLVCREGSWFLVSFGRHGVLVSNQLVNEHAAGNELFFRLGVQGPAFRFSVSQEAEDIGATYVATAADTSQFELDEARFALDEARLQREVGEVVESEYFQKLQRLAKEMRSQREKD